MNRNLHVTKRYFRLKKSSSIEHALGELITNAHDAYTHADDGTKRIDVTMNAVTKTITVTDWGCGMNTTTMKRNLTYVGLSTVNDASNRGYFSSGLKELTHIGELRLVTTFNGSRSAIAFHKDDTYALEYTDVPLSNAKDTFDGVTQVVLYVSDVNFTLLTEQQLSRLASIRYLITDTNTVLNYTIVRSNNLTTVHQNVKWDCPAVKECTCDVEFHIPGDTPAKARFTLNVLDAKQPDRNIVEIRSSKGTKEVTFLQSRYSSHPYLRYFQGVLFCDHIDRLMLEYEHDSSISNPCPVELSNRSGLDRKHPFVTKLLALPSLLLEYALSQFETQYIERFPSSMKVDVFGLCLHHKLLKEDDIKRGRFRSRYFRVQPTKTLEKRLQKHVSEYQATYLEPISFSTKSLKSQIVVEFSNRIDSVCDIQQELATLRILFNSKHPLVIQYRSRNTFTESGQPLVQYLMAHALAEYIHGTDGWATDTPGDPVIQSVNELASLLAPTLGEYITW